MNHNGQLEEKRKKFLTTCLFLPLLFLFLLWLAPPAASQTSNLAGLVVDFNGRVETRCISFTEPQLSGYELLVRSGLPFAVEVGGIGSAVCEIDGTGCPVNNCFCQCPGGSTCTYWTYWHLSSGSWQYSMAGATLYQVQPGQVDGWKWGGGSGSPPLSTSFEQICSAYLATATPTATNTAEPPTPTSTPTNTPVATATLPPSINFSAGQSSVPAGGCTKLQWQVNQVQAVYLDGQAVEGQGEKEVCPAQTQTYQLRVVYSGGEQTQAVTVQVVALTSTIPATLTSTPQPAATNTRPGTVGLSSATPSVTAEVTDEPTAAPSSTPTSAPFTPEVVVVLLPTLTPSPTAAPTLTPQTVAMVTPLPTPSPMPPAPEPAASSFDVVGYVIFGVLTAGLLIWLWVVKKEKK